MKTKLFVLLLILGITVLAAEPYDIDLRIVGPTYYNVLRVSSFDVKVPQNQPRFFTLSAENKTPTGIDRPYLHFELLWNSESLVNSKSLYKSTFLPGRIYQITNRDIFMESESGGEHSFGTPSPKISITDIIDKNLPQLRDTVLSTGLFPDGRYTFTAQFKDQTGRELSTKLVFHFYVRNPGGLFLITPGVPLGGSNIPLVSFTPVSFRWSSNLADGSKKFKLLVKEYEDVSSLSPGFVEVSGNTVLDVEVTGSFYSDFLDLKEGRYYAWQVSTAIEDPTVRTSSFIKSPFNVFRFSSEGDDENLQNIKNIEFFLINLNIPELMSLIGQGYAPTGIIEYRGRVFSGAEIQAVIDELLSRNIIRIELLD